MEQLPGGDAVFLGMEIPEAPGHVGGLTVLDPSAAPEFGFARLVEVVSERIGLAPRYTQKLREVALGLDRPYLVHDPDFDAAKHIHRIAVPAPGGMRELADLIAYLFSRPLDRRKPLWELWFIEGVENERAALFMKSHHCLMDGQAGAGLGELLCDLEPNPERGPILPPASSPRGQRELSDLEIALRGAGNLIRTPLRMASFGGRLLRQSWEMLRSARDPESPPLPFSLPQTPFNRQIGSQRAFACASLSLEQVKEVKKHFDVTVNDVLLALTGSALRTYLDQRLQLPERPLAGLIAISKRSQGDLEMGNQITSVPVGLATDIADPVQRLLRIHRNAAKAKQMAKAYDADMLRGIGESLPPGLLNLLMRAMNSSEAPAGQPANVIVSNVRGTPVPLYCAGARIECMYPMSILAPGQGLNVTMVSYMGRVDVGFTVDPELVPDAWQLAEEVPRALTELLSAARQRVEAEARAARG